MRYLIDAFRSAPSVGASWTTDAAHSVTFYSRARFALGDAAMALAGDRPVVDVWLPGYICDEAVEPFRNARYRLNFYGITDQLEPDWSALQGRVAGGLFILIHYFGFSSTVEAASEFCGLHRADLIEDAAHALIPLDSRIGCSKATVYSPRKMLAIPSGGMLVLRDDCHPRMAQQPPRESQLEFGSWLFRKLASRLANVAGVGNMTQRVQGTSQGAGPRPTDLRPGCDPRSLQMLRAAEKGLIEITDRRRENYLTLLNGLDFSDDVRPALPTLQAGITPYLFALRVTSNRDSLVQRLRKAGVPAGTWPTLPEEVMHSSLAGHATAFRDQTLTLPVHQGITRRQAVEMAGVVNQCLAERCN